MLDPFVLRPGLLPPAVPPVPAPTSSDSVQEVVPGLFVAGSFQPPLQRLWRLGVRYALVLEKLERPEGQRMPTPSFFCHGLFLLGVRLMFGTWDHHIEYRDRVPGAQVTKLCKQAPTLRSSLGSSSGSSEQNPRTEQGGITCFAH